MRPQNDDPILSARDDAALDAAVAERVERAGARPEPPEEDLAAIRAAARETFRTTHGAGRPFVRRFAPALAAVAALLVAAVGVQLWSGGDDPGSTIATVAGATVGRIALLHGDVRLEGAPGSLAVGSPVRAGATLVSAADPGVGGTVRLASGGELRIDSGARVRFESPSQIRLERGAVYFDSGFETAETAAASFEVATTVARFRHVGTQFEVRIVDAGGTTRLRVREGRVRFGDAGEATAGEELVLDESGRVERGRVSTHSAEWSWVVAAAPIPETEGWDVVRFLSWFGRETGRAIEFADPELREEAAAARLHGGLAGLTPDEAIEVVLESAGVTARTTNGVLRIDDATP